MFVDKIIVDQLIGIWTKPPDIALKSLFFVFVVETHRAEDQRVEKSFYFFKRLIPASLLKKNTKVCISVQ